MTSVSITAFDDGTVVQRSEGVGSFAIGGDCAADSVAVLARVVDATTGAAVTGWQTIDTTVGEGHFEGTLTDIPQGGWYRVEVRTASDSETVVSSEASFGVGVLVAALGQSNMARWFEGDSPLPANDLCRMFDGTDWREVTGYGATAYADALADALDVPVGLIDAAQAASSLTAVASRYWLDTAEGSPYAAFLAMLAAVGGNVELVLWAQGEKDAKLGVDRDSYLAGLSSLFERLRADLGDDALAILIQELGLGRNADEAAWSGIRSAQQDYAAADPATVIGAETLGLQLDQLVHYTGPSYFVAGWLMAEATLALLGQTTTTAIIAGDDAAQVLGGTARDDIIMAGGGDDVVEGRGGSDALLGEDGDDVVRGGAGDDLIGGGAGNDRIFGNGGDDDLWGEDGDDVVSGGSGGDRLYGNEGNDHLFGDWLADRLDGGAGDDVLDGGPGRDRITTGAGSDVVVIGSRNGAGDAVTDFGAGDRLDLIGAVAEMGVESGDLVELGYLAVRLNTTGLASLVMVDWDGGGDDWQLLVRLPGVTALAADALILPEGVSALI